MCLRRGTGGLRETGDLEAVIVLAPFAAVEDGDGNFFDGEVLKHGGLAAECAAADEEAAGFADFIADPGELVVGEDLGGDVEVIVFGGMPLLAIRSANGSPSRDAES